MAKKLLALLAGVVLASSVLSGCGGTTPVASGLKATTATETKVDAQSRYTVDRAKRIATDALYRYDNLRDDWQRAYSDYEKDRIEERMLSTLTRAVTDVRQAASGGYGYESRRVYDIADQAIDRYESLRRRWQRAWGDRERREIVNDMLVELTAALKDIQRVR